MFGRLLVLGFTLAAALPSGAALTGTVVDADGAPVAGARVTAYQLEGAEAGRIRILSDKPERPPLGRSETSATGRFSLDWPKEHPVAMMQIDAAGFAPHSIRVERDDNIGTVALVAGPPITGRITAGGKPLSGARVVVVGQSEHIVSTDDQGRYTAPDPQRWASRVYVVHRDYAMLDEVVRRPPGTKISLDRSLQPGITLTGRVVGRDGKTLVAGARISVDGWPLATSGEDGVFAVPHVGEKWEWVSARTVSMAGRRARGGSTIIQLQPAISINGVVRDSKGSLPIAGAEVSLMPATRFELRPTDIAVSDAKGMFTITGVAAGSFNLIANRPGYAFEPVSASVTADSTPLRTLLGRRLGRVAGTVIDEQKRPVPGARVQALHVSSRGRGVAFSGFGVAPANQPGTTAPDGTFLIRVEAEADLQIEASKKGFPEARTQTLQVAEGERKSGVIITIPHGVLVTGRVTDLNDQPLAGVTVGAAEARAASGMSMVFRMRQREDDYVKTGPDGTYGLQVKEGRWDLGFRKDGFAAKTLRGHEITSAGSSPINITLGPGVEITGRVTRSGAGVPGALVITLGEGSTQSSFETGADGSFSIGDLTPGPLMLRVYKEDEFIELSRPITAPVRDLEIEVPAAGQLAGRVIDKDTKAPVRAFDAGVSQARGGPIMGRTSTRPFTSDDGTFTLTNAPVGTITLVVNAAGYTQARIPSINVEEGKSTNEIEVAMDRGVRVTGRVTGPDGNALGGVTIRHWPVTERQMPIPNFASAATTDSSGEYVIEAVEPGQTAFAFTRSGFVTAEKSAELKGRDVRVDAQLDSGIRVSGTVTTEDGAPAAEAAVSAMSSGARTSSAHTRADQNGNFRFEAIAPGRYTFSATKQGYPRTELRDTDVSNGAPVRLVLKTGGTIYGRVTGLSAEEMSSSIVTASNTNGSAMTPIDSAGDFRLEGAPVGTVRLTARTGQGFASTSRTSAPKSVQVEAGASIQQDISFNSDTVIRGRVTRQGRAVSGASVSFSPRSGQAQTYARTRADQEGSYEVTGLDDATYSVTVSDAAGGSSFMTTYQVRGSGNFDIDIRSTTLRGRVLDATSGAPLADAMVELRERETTGRYAMRMAKTDNAGTFVMDSVSEGEWNVTAEKEGYGTRVLEVTVGPSPSDLEVKLKPNPGVTLRVVDARDGRTLDAFVLVTDQQDRVVYDSPSRFGSFAAPAEVRLGLEPGTYRALISAQSYAPRVVSISSPGSQTVALTPGGSITIQSKGGEIRRARLMGPDNRAYPRSGYSPNFAVDPSPGVTQLNNIAPGPYTLQILGPRDEVLASAQVLVVEGQTAVVDL